MAQIMNSKFGLECTIIPALAATTTENLSYLTNDPELWRILQDSSLYMIGKRACLNFKDLIITTSNIKGEIVQIGTSNSIHFNLPLIQKDIVRGDERSIEIKCSHNKSYLGHLTSIGIEYKDLDYIDTILIYEGEENGGELIKYITPDLILERTISNSWSCEINGEIESFLGFEILYIGEAVRSDIWKRISRHEKIQQILSQESPINIGVALAQEVHVLFFNLNSTSDTRIVNQLSNEQLAAYLSTQDQTDDRVLFFDIEKAFIKLLKPKYNLQMYDNYPESDNGMIQEGYSHLLYKINFPYSLKTESNHFVSNHNSQETDVLHVDFEQKTVEIKKNKATNSR